MEALIAVDPIVEAGKFLGALVAIALAGVLVIAFFSALAAIASGITNIAKELKRANDRKESKGE